MPRGVKGSAISDEQRRARKRESQRKWRERNPHYSRDWWRQFYGPHRPRYLHYARRGHLKAKYGISLEDYDAMLASQDGVCAICKSPPDKRRLAVDHCHDTGIIRALLCGHCNRRLGVIENTEFVEKALAYLASHKPLS